MAGPVRILHFIPGFGFGGIESTFLAHCRHLDWSRYAFDVLIETQEELPALETLRQMGGRVLRIPKLNKKAPWRYTADMKALMHKLAAEYPIVHSRDPSRTFPFLYYAKKYGIKHRIVHAHTTVPSNKYPFLFNHVILPLNNHYATHFCACGQKAGKIFFGRRDFHWVKNGVDLARFENICPEKIDETRLQLGLTADNLVFGNVCRFCYPKNLVRSIDIFRCVRDREPLARFLLIGDGPDEPLIRKKIEQHHLENDVILTGRKPGHEVTVLLRVMDVLFLPSRYEGFPNVVTEAVSSGLTCLLSDVIDYPHYSTHIQSKSLDDHNESWAECLVQLARNHEYYPGVEVVRQAGFDIADSARDLCAYYDAILK